MGEFGPWHIVIVLLVFALLFGGKRLPDAARGLGQSLRVFRREMNAAAQPTPDPVPAAQSPADRTPPTVTAPVPEAVASVSGQPGSPADHT
jgi:sec-independent protein translocase protein TatA